METTLNIETRSETKKNACYRLRQAGKVPGIIYGPNLKEPTTISIEHKELVKVYKTTGQNRLIHTKGADGLDGHKVLIANVQVHPYRNEVVHCDLHQLNLKKAMRTTVPLQFEGTAKGIKDGGLFTVLAREVEIKSLPTDIPPVVKVDISDIGLSENIQLSTLAEQLKDAPFEFIYESDIALASVIKPEEEEVKAVEEEDTAVAAVADPAKAAEGEKKADDPKKK